MRPPQTFSIRPNPPLPSLTVAADVAHVDHLRDLRLAKPLSHRCHDLGKHLGDRRFRQTAERHRIAHGSGDVFFGGGGGGARGLGTVLYFSSINHKVRCYRWRTWRIKARPPPTSTGSVPDLRKAHCHRGDDTGRRAGRRHGMGTAYVHT